MRVVTTKQPNPLAKAVHQPGGMTLNEAVRAADAKLEAIREEVTSEVNNMVDRILEMGPHLVAARDDAAADTLYALSNTVVGTAGTFGMATLGDVSFSLCALLDRMRTTRHWDVPALQVHLDTLRLLRSRTLLTSDQQSAIIAALARVVQRP